MGIIKLLLNILIYFGCMFSISIAVAVGVKAGLKLYFENESSKNKED